MIRIKVSGQRSLTQKLQRLKKEQREAAAQAVEEILRDVASEVRRTLRQGPSPRSRTGRLADSIFVHLNPDRLGGVVGTDLPYGRHLEFGTRKMAARPWLHPTFERLKPRIRGRIAQAVKDANRTVVRGSGRSRPQSQGEGVD